MPLKFQDVTTGNAADNFGTAYTVTISKPASVAVGDAVLVAVIYNDTTGPYAITGLTQLDTVNLGVTTRPRFTTYYRKIDGTEGASWSFNYTGGRSLAWAVVAYRPDGTKTIAVDDHRITAGAAGTTTSVTTPAATATTPADMSVAIFAGAPENTTIWTTPGLTQRANVTDPSTVENMLAGDSLETASGAIAGKTGTLGQGVSESLVGTLILLKQT